MWLGLFSPSAQRLAQAAAAGDMNMNDLKPSQRLHGAERRNAGQNSRLTKPEHFCRPSATNPAAVMSVDMRREWTVGADNEAYSRS